MKNADAGERKARRNRKIRAWIILILLIALTVNHVTNRQVALSDIRWNITPVEMEIIFGDQEPILVTPDPQRFALRVFFMQNRDMLREMPQEGDFKVRFRYEVDIWFALFIPLVQDWGGTATFYADRSLVPEILRIIEEFE